MRRITKLGRIRCRNRYGKATTKRCIRRRLSIPIYGSYNIVMRDKSRAIFTIRSQITRPSAKR